MDSLFDDRTYEVGDEIEAYCPNARCRGDTVHVINSMYENEIRRVQCSVCSDVHAFRKPRGIPFDSPLEPLKTRIKKKPSWSEAMAKVTESELVNCRPYSTLDSYELLDVVSHPRFDVGFVTELLSDNKVEITFKEERKILVHRRGHGQFDSTISNVPAPRQRARRKRRGKRGPSEVAEKLMNQRMLASANSENFAQVAEAKEAVAERAAQENRRLALELIITKLERGIDLTPAEQENVGDAKRLAKETARKKAEEERELKRQAAEAEKEKRRLEREKEREKERERKAKEREKERIRKEKDRLRALKAKEREREKLRKQKEREQKAALRDKEREQKAALREKERERKEREREKERERKEREKIRGQKERERERKKAAAERVRSQREAKRRREAAVRARKVSASEAARLRRTGGKKTTTAVARRTGGKKSTTAIARRTGGKKSTTAVARRTGRKKTVRRAR